GPTRRVSARNGRRSGRGGRSRSRDDIGRSRRSHRRRDSRAHRASPGRRPRGGIRLNQATDLVVDRITTHSESETAAVAQELAGKLRAGSVVLLIGDLGAGKTAFVRGLARGLGIAPQEVSSPTFTLIR